MSIFDNIEHDTTIEGEKDSLGGRAVLDTNIYLLDIKKAYVTQSEGGAKALNLEALLEDGKEFRSTFYFTSGTAKGGKNYYEKDGEKKYLPGYLMANSLSELATGKDFVTLGKETVEEKVIPLYNKESKAEVPTKVPMLMGLVGAKIYAAIFKQLEDKNEKNADGAYVPTGDTRETNEIDKFFCAKEGFEKKTSTEIRTKADATFFDQWLEKNKGNVKDKSTKGAVGSAGAPKAGGPGKAAGTKPTSSLFG